ncbi:hypothetical protein P3T24_001336 [Paraburkholderia sp. GAS33]
MQSAYLSIRIRFEPRINDALADGMFAQCRA